MNAMARTCRRINWTTSHQPPERSVGDLGGGSPESRHPLRGPLQARATDRLDMVRLNNSRSKPSGLSHSDSPRGGFIGRGSHGLSRPDFTEALTGKVGISWIRAAKPDAKRLFDGAHDDTHIDWPTGLARLKIRPRQPANRRHCQRLHRPRRPAYSGH